MAQDFYKESCELQIMFFQLQFNQKQLKTSQSRHGSNIFKHQGLFIKDSFKVDLKENLQHNNTFTLHINWSLIYSFFGFFIIKWEQII